MERNYWLRQEPGKPLFPELEWSRPENRLAAGKLLVIGGNAHGFAAPAEAYAAATKAGAGTVRVLLPDAVRKIVGMVLENGEFAPSTPVSGSFSQKALADFLSLSAWADSVLLAGDLGRNSETAILMEKYLSEHPAAITITRDAIDYVVAEPQCVLSRPGTLLVLSLSQLQRLGTTAKFPRPVTFGMDLLHLVEWLHDFTTEHQLYIVVKHHNQLVAAVHGQVSSSRMRSDLPVWRQQTAAITTVWWMQNPSKPFEAITTGISTMA